MLDNRSSSLPRTTVKTGQPVLSVQPTNVPQACFARGTKHLARLIHYAKT